MPADSDNDSPMLSSASAQPSDQIPNMPPTPEASTRSSASGANSNGKRPLNTISNGHSDSEDTVYYVDDPSASSTGQDNFNGSGTGQASATQAQERTHPTSGYRWSRVEDEPGYAWLNKKAMDEHQRALDGLVHKEFAVMNRYGDPIEAAEKERAVMESLRLR